MQSARIKAFLLSIPFVAGVAAGAGMMAASAVLLGSSAFPDVPAGSYFDEAVGEMYAEGIIKGYDGGRFGPDDFVTRAQVAVMMKRLRDDLLGVVPEVGSSRSRSRSSESESSISETSSSKTSSSASTSSTFSKNPNGAFRFTSGGFTVQENAATHVATISVVRFGGARGQVSVEYALSGATATAGTDFTASTAVLTFADTETSKTFQVQINDDTATEGNETVKITLKNPTGGASLDYPSAATLTIVDNETVASSSAGTTFSSSSVPAAGALTLNASTFNIYEKGGAVTITVTRIGGSSGEVGISYATNGGSATSGGDYSAVSGTLTFAAGETVKTFTLTPNDDSSIEGNETFNIALSSPTGGSVLGSVATASATITDDESAGFGTGALKLSKSSYEISEGDVLKVTVQRVSGAKGAVSVNYAAAGGTATSGSDYQATSGTLTFLPGESSKVVSIAIGSDTQSDGEETFNFILSSPTNGATIEVPGSASVILYE